MARFDRVIETAKRLIKKNGQLVKWRVIRDGAPADPSKPWIPATGVPVEHDVSICFLPTDREGRELLHYLRGTEVPTGNLIGLMGAVPFEPVMKDLVVRDSLILRIANVDKLAPNGQAILYTVEFVS